MPAPIRDECHYLVATPLDHQLGLSITAVGCQFVPPGAAFCARGHSPAHDYLWQHGRVLREYAIVYVIRGQGEFESRATGKRPVAAGNTILLFPNVWHRYRPLRKTGWDSYWVTFKGDYADRLRERGVLNSNEPVVETGVDELILRPFRSLLDRARSQPLGLQSLAAADTIAVVAGMLNALQHRTVKSHIHEAVRRAKIVIEAADDLPDVQRLAEDQGLSRTHFHHVFKQCTGLSPYQYSLQLRMSRAKEMLCGSALSIKQIALRLKFDSASQFSKIFKKKIGLSPLQYRRDPACLAARGG